MDYVETMTAGKRRALFGALLIAAMVQTGCSAPACDSSLRFNTLTLDFSSLPTPGSGLDFVIGCPGRESCSDRPANKRFDADAESSVFILPGVRSVHVTVYEKGSQSVVAETTKDPVPWDPPVEPNKCPVPAKATLKL